MSGRPSRGWSEAIAATALPAVLVLAIGPRGVGLVLAWAVLAILAWVVIGLCVPGPWGRTERVATLGGASLIAAIGVAWLC